MHQFQKRNSVICFAGKIIAVLLTVFVFINLLEPVFIPKYYGTWATTAVMDGFYELENNSIDVIVLGSSQVMTAVSPMQLFDETGITSYNMGTEQQNLITSYYLLKEVLRYQKPKVVVLDVLFLHKYYEESVLNSEEEIVRKTFDYMKWSTNKWEAVNTICSLDKEHKIQNYILPFLRFHSRWSELKKSDFLYLFKNKENMKKGFSIIGDKTVFDFEGFICEDSSNVETPLETMTLYFEKIVSLCDEKGISIVLIKTPRGLGSFTEAQHNGVQAFADYYDLPFLDFNEKKLFDEIGFDCSEDCMDGSHVNYYGSVKITGYLSGYLSDNYLLENRKNNPSYSSWNNDLENYNEVINKVKNKNY